MVRIVTALAFALTLSSTVGCDGPNRFKPTQMGGGVVEVHAADAVLTHGEVGAGQFKGPGTYVLVDALNPLGVDLEVTLGGDLVNGAGERVGALNRESLRIPARGRRTFALVHHDGQVTAATGADIRVEASQIAKHPPAVTLADANVARDGDRVIVRANLINETDREVITVVVAGFYDENGKIMNRPFTVLTIPGDWKTPAQFVGPHGSAKGYLFVGEQVY